MTEGIGYEKFTSTKVLGKNTTALYRRSDLNENIFLTIRSRFHREIGLSGLYFTIARPNKTAIMLSKIQFIPAKFVGGFYLARVIHKNIHKYSDSLYCLQ